MDIFNKIKVRELEAKIYELENKLDCRENKIKRLEKELDYYKEKENEKKSKKHSTGVWCQNCKNLISYSSNSNFACNISPAQFCILDNECTDREVT